MIWAKKKYFTDLNRFSKTSFKDREVWVCCTTRAMVAETKVLRMHAVSIYAPGRPKGLKRSKLKSGEKIFDLGDINQCEKEVVPIVDN
ncbi:hypothetical protein Hdeb2414_s0913g00960631 [Helianthus debilis subsp. tardiflorus]